MSTKIDCLEKRIGMRVRIERESRGWSLSELAERSTVSRAMIYKIERAESSPTATVLAKLSGAFSLSMSALLARAELPEGRLLRKQDQPVWIDPASGYVRRHVSPPSDLPLDLVQVDLPVGATIPMPASSYAFQRQLIWVLRGDLVFVEGDIRHELGEGDCLELGAPADCVFKNESGQVCTYAVAVMRIGR